MNRGTHLVYYSPASDVAGAAGARELSSWLLVNWKKLRTTLDYPVTAICRISSPMAKVAPTSGTAHGENAYSLIGNREFAAFILVGRNNAGAIRSGRRYWETPPHGREKAGFAQESTQENCIR